MDSGFLAQCLHNMNSDNHLAWVFIDPACSHLFFPLSLYVYHRADNVSMLTHAYPHKPAED